MDVPTYILNHEAVVRFFGDWPSFHDAKVVAYRLEADSIAFTLHTWRMTNEVDAKGYFVEGDHALMSFRFHGLHDLRMDAFRSGNSLFGLEMTWPQESSFIHVQLDSVMDLSGSFSARSGKVVSVLPCTSDGRATLQT